MLKTLAFQELSKAINKILATDPFALNLFSQLANQSLRVQVLKTPFDVCVHFYKNRVSIMPYDDHEPATVTLTGTPSALLRFAKTDSHTQMLMDKQIKIVGDLDLLMEVKKIQAVLMIDWEGLLANYIGDFAANRVGLLVRRAKSKLASHFHLIKEDALDYVHNEALLLPTVVEVNEFYDALRDFRQDLERFERDMKKYQLSGRA